MLAIQKASYELEQGYQPAITFIVVVKRHHGRFNILSREDGVNCSFYFVFFINFSQKKPQKSSEIIGSISFACVFFLFFFSGLLSLIGNKEKMKRENEKSQDNY